MADRRILVVTPVVPPSASGQSVVLGRLLAEGPAEVVFATQSPPEGGRPDVVTLRHARFHGSEVWPRLMRPAVSFLLTAQTLVRRTLELVRAVRRRDIHLLVGCTAGPTELPAACLAAFITRRPFVAYVFDDPVFQWPPGPIRRFAAIAERLWIRRVAAVLVPNARMASVFEARTGLSAVVVPNPVPTAAFAEPADRPFRANLQLLYTGSVYGAQADALAAVAEAIPLLSRPARLEVLSINTRDEIAALGIDLGFVDIAPHVDSSDVIERQRSADLLVLPLAFRSSIPEVIDSSAPAKLGEYLASGTPILALAPVTSFLAEYLDSHGAAVVVTTVDPAAIARAIDELVVDEGVRRRLVSAARALSRSYDESASRRTFWGVIGSVLASPAG